MRKLNDCLASKFYNLCDDIKMAHTSEDLNFHIGVACGFASGLLLSHAIDFDCYTAMQDYISVVFDGWHSTK